MIGFENEGVIMKTKVSKLPSPPSQLLLVWRDT